jgi:hypothetical protein
VEEPEMQRLESLAEYHREHPFLKASERVTYVFLSLHLPI